MSEDNSWTFPQKIGVTAGVFTILGVPSAYDVLANNSAILTWIGSTVRSGLTAEIRVWQALVVMILFGLLGYVGWKYFKDNTEQALGIDWIANDEDEDLRYPIPLCPECGIELDINSKTLDTHKSHTPGVQSIEATVCAMVTCDHCGFEKDWQEITDDVVHTLTNEGSSDVAQQIRNKARKRIEAKRRHGR